MIWEVVSDCHSFYNISCTIGSGIPLTVDTSTEQPYWVHSCIICAPLPTPHHTPREGTTCLSQTIIYLGGTLIGGVVYSRMSDPIASMTLRQITIL